MYKSVTLGGTQVTAKASLKIGVVPAGKLWRIYSWWFKPISGNFNVSYIYAADSSSGMALLAKTGIVTLISGGSSASLGDVLPYPVPALAGWSIYTDIVYFVTAGFFNLFLLVDEQAEGTTSFQVTIPTGMI